MAINFSAQFIVNEKTSTRVLRLTDTSTGFTLSKGNFIVTFPDGSVVSNTDFSSPEISAPGGNTSISLITDIDNTVLTGTYVINYVALDTSLNEYNKTETFDFNWEKPAKAIINDSDVVLPEVQFKDLTAYETSGSFTGTLTRNFYTTTPSTSEVGVITKTSVGDILTPSHLTKYYEGIYLVNSDISVAYTHTSKSWLTVAYTDLLQETFDVREAPTQDELVALMNTYKDQIEAYKTTNPSQYEIMNEQYDLVLALYSHILARYETNTLGGSKAILDQLLGLLPPTEPYTYKATQMLPFTINFSTSLTGTGTTGTIPKFTAANALGDSIIRESGGMIGIGKAPTTVLDVNGTIQGTAIVKSGGTSSEFLKADGSIDSNTYLTTGSAASNYQPLDGDLTAIAGLAGTIGLLRKTSANTWELDTSVYLTGINSGQITTALGYTPENAANKGVNNGYAGLDSTGKVPSTQLPSYVDDVIEAANLAALPATGETGKIYVTLDTNKIYRWTGSVYVEVSPTVGVVWGAISGTLANQTDLQSALDAKQANLTLTTTGTSGAATLVGSTLNIPIYQGGVTSFNTRTGAITLTSSDVTTALGFTPVTNARTLTINGLTQDLSDNRSWTVSGTIPSGGTAGQILAKIDATNYNTQWIDNFASQLKHEVKLGATLTKGKAVYVSSADGTNMIVSAASNASEATSSKTLGLLETGGATNALVKVVTEGLLAGLDTSTATAGDPVWLGTDGNLIFGLTNKPTAPAHLVFIGIVTRVQSNNGEIFVKVQNGFELNEIHDVSIVSKANNDGLFYEASTGLWKNKSIATVLGYTPQAQLDGTGFVKISGTTISYDNNTYATTTQLDLKANILNPVFTDNIYISGTNPRLYFTDTDSNPDYTIFIDEGNFYILNQTSGAYKLLIQETGNISAGVGNSMIATSFIRRGGTSEQFLMADGSVSEGDVFNYPGIGIAVSGGGGWLTSIDDNSANWNAAYSARISSLTTTGNSGAATLASNVLNIPNYTIAGLGGQPAFTSGTGFVKISGTTISYVDETYYLASNPSGYITSAALAPYLPLAGGTLTGALGGTSATFSGDVTANSFVKSGGTSSQFLKADGSVDIRSFVTTGALDNYLPLTGGSLTNSLSSGYVLSVTNTTAAADANGLYVNIASGSTGTPFRVDRGGVSLISVNYLGATLLKSTITANAFIKASGTSSEYLMADGSVSTGLSFTYPDAGIVVSTGTAWGTSITDNSSNWNTAYSLRIASATAPLNITGTTISISQAGASANGFLSSTDWNTFNNKVSTSALSAYLPLSGGTLAGALSGTSASFSSTLSASSTTLTASANTYAGGALRLNSFTGGTSIYLTSSGGFFALSNGGGADHLLIASTGAATFASSVTAGQLIVSAPATTSYGSLNAVTSGYAYQEYKYSGTAYGYIGQQSSFIAGSSNTDLGIVSLNNLIFGTGGSFTERMRITSAGNVGIGTTSPTNGKLVISDSGSNKLSLDGGSSQNGMRFEATGGANAFYLFNGTISSAGFGIYNVSSGAFPFFATNAGNVGIGTTSPGSLLTLYATTTPTIAFQNSGAVRGYLSADSANNIYNAVTGNGHVFQCDSTERMRITSGGNVGIGTTAPNRNLHIKSSNGGATAQLQFESIGTVKGYMGVFSDTIYITSGGTFNSGWSLDGSFGVASMELNSFNGGSTVLFSTANSNSTPTERMRITSDGKVMIGTTSAPGAAGVYTFTVRQGTDRKFSIAQQDGELSLESYNDTNSVGVPMRIYSSKTQILNGNVLLGTTTDNGNRLQVNGSVSATSFFESSDKTIKTLIEDNYQTKGIESVTAKLYLKNGVEELGYFAQDVQAILPSAVNKGADGLLNLSYREVHTAKIARLEKRVEELEAQLNLI